MTHFSGRAELESLGYSPHQARRIWRSMLRRADFSECAALFEGDPTGLVAALRSLGYPVPAVYAASHTR